MNYIKRLEIDLKEVSHEAAALKMGIRDLMGYLHSEKFFADTTVQVDDIIRRLLEVEAAANDAKEGRA